MKRTNNSRIKIRFKIIFAVEKKLERLFPRNQSKYSLKDI